MHALLTPLLQLQRFFIPTLLVLLVWAAWRTMFRKDFSVGLALYISLVVVVDGFYNTGIYIPGLEVGSIRYSELCVPFLLASRRPASDVVVPRGTLLLVSAYFLLMFIAAVRAEPMMQGIMDYRRIVVPQIIAFILAYRGFVTAVEYRRFLLSVTALVLLVGVFCFWDVYFDRWILHSDMLGKPEYYHNRRLGRFGSIFLNPNNLGAFVVLLFPPLFAALLKERVRLPKLYLGVGLLGLIFSLVETQSRAPLIAFAGSIALIVLAPFSGLSRTRRLLALGAIATILAVFMPGFLEHASKRFDTLEQETSQDEVSRATIWQYSRKLIAQHPFGGVGFGEDQFLAAMATTDFRENFGEQSLDNPHNSFLQAAVYAGVPALAVFLLAIAAVLKKALGVLRHRSDPERPSDAVFGLFIGVIAFMVCSLANGHLFTANVGPVFWLVFGLLLASTAQVRQARRAAAPSAARHAGAI